MSFRIGQKVAVIKNTIAGPKGTIHTVLATNTCSRCGNTSSHLGFYLRNFNNRPPYDREICWKCKNQISTNIFWFSNTILRPVDEMLNSEQITEKFPIVEEKPDTEKIVEPQKQES